MNDLVGSLGRALNIDIDIISSVLLFLIVALLIFGIVSNLYVMLIGLKTTLNKGKIPKEANEIKESKHKKLKKNKGNRKKRKGADSLAAEESCFDDVKKDIDVNSETVNIEPKEQIAASEDIVKENEHLENVVDALGENKKHKKSEMADEDKKKGKKKKVSPRKSSKALKKKAVKLKIPKSVQDSIPYYAVYDDGIIETEPGHFTKTYLLHDVNYQVAKEDEQVNMFLKYGEFLNSFDPTCTVQITINQKNINMEEFEENTMIPLKNDHLDYLRIERNEMLKKKMLEGKNNLVKEKYLTVNTKAPTYEAAEVAFARMDSEIVSNLKKIGGAGAQVLSLSERLEILHDIYNLGDEGMFGNNMIINKKGELVWDKEKFKLDIMHRMGLTTKDMIGPESFTFKSDYGMIGDKYFRALYLRQLPSFLQDNVLKQLTDTDCNMITSLIFQPIEGETALKMARGQIRNINANLVEKQKQASKAGYSAELISPELMDAANEAKELFHDLTGKNQKLFYLTLVIVHFAEDKEQLDSDTKSIMNIGRKLLTDIKKLSWQQENGLASVLPLCNNQLQIKRSLTTESAAVLMPFVNQELIDRDGGMYYGNNAVSHNLVMLNRRNSKNGNGFILGTPGSGKSMSAKQEMLTVLLESDDDVIVIDPENEYSPMVDLLGGHVVRIAPGANVHINPFDLEMDNDSEDEPITIKSDYIVSLCETVIGDRYGLTPAQRSLIDRCVRRVYEPFLNSYDQITGQYDKEKLPTLVDFYNELRAQPTSSYDANQLADSLEIYVTGSMNVFAHRTNVDYDNRFVVYDIKDIGSTMKTMGLLVVLDNIWNRIVAGRKEGKNVWFFIDEIYLLFKTESSADFLRQLYKRARKYGGIPTGITQNVEDLLNSDTARSMLSNSEYIQMLNQSPADRSVLAQLLNISGTQLGFITNAQPGEGLIYNGTFIVPFVNKLPKETKQYKAMTTKLSEVKEREAQIEEELREKEEEASTSSGNNLSVSEEIYSS